MEKTAFYSSGTSSFVMLHDGITLTGFQTLSGMKALFPNFVYQIAIFKTNVIFI